MECAFRQISATALAPAAHWNLGWFQRLTLGVAILDTSIQVDAYLFYQDKFADVGAIGGLNISVATICLGVLFALWLIEAAIATTYGQRSQLYVNLPLTLYILVSTLSWVVAQEKLLALSSIVLLGQTYLLYEYVANKVRTRDDVVFVVSIFAAALAIQGIAMIGLRALGHGVEWGPVTGIIGTDMRVGGTIGS
ncbi:MAG TPA: hypothetical protein VHU84_13025, partial [Lacipirellulaceae bacterium]|nr:hypothetical protein [Lacipirellulaceae bacterium]